MGMRDASRREYGLVGERATHEEIKTGALQRIADATEVMARNYQQLIDERDTFRRWYRSEKAANERLARSNAALRGTITKLKRQIAELRGEEQ